MVPKLCQRYGASSGNDSRFLLSSSSAFSRLWGFVRSSTSVSMTNRFRTDRRSALIHCRSCAGNF